MRADAATDHCDGGTNAAGTPIPGLDEQIRNHEKDRSFMEIRIAPRTALIAASVAALAVGAAVPAVAATSTAAGARVAIAGDTPGWASAGNYRGTVASGTRLSVELALAPRDESEAQALAAEIATPGSRDYHKYLTPSQYDARFAPSQSEVAQVTAWLRSQGLSVTSVASNRHFITASATAAQAETAFGTHLGLYQIQGKTLRSPSTPVTIPSALSGVVTDVLGLDQSGDLTSPDHVVADTAVAPVSTSAQPDHTSPRLLNGASAAAADTTACSQYWDQNNDTAVPQKYAAGYQSNAVCGYYGAQVQGAYGIGGSGENGSGQTVAIVDAYASTTMEADANKYFAAVGLPTFTSGQYSQVLPGSFDDPSSCESPSDWATEESLDVESVHTLAPAAKVVYAAAADCNSLYTALNTVVSNNLANIVSDSWSQTGEDVPAAEQSQAQSIFVEAALQGIGIYFSSGDHGDNQGNPDNGSPSVNFPASSPWVTSVGGTATAIGSSDNREWETGWEDGVDSLSGSTWSPAAAPNGPFSSGAGGGHSSLYAEPSWQDSVVPSSISHGMRTVPDISADADPNTPLMIGLTVDGTFEYMGIGGTSLASPLIAATMADAQQVQGGSDIGLAAPSLYKLAGTSALRDVTHVSAGAYIPSSPSGTAGSSLYPFDAGVQSLKTTAGYDDVTGLGVPNGTTFLQQVGK